MSEPFLNLLHGNPIVKQQACTGMAKIMEANATETIFDQKLGKSFSDVIGPNHITDFIYTQIAKVL